MDLYLIYHTKINSRHIKDLNVINKVIKLIENNIKKKTLWSHSKEEFLKQEEKTQAINGMINQFDYIKIENFYLQDKVKKSQHISYNVR